MYKHLIFIRRRAIRSVRKKSELMLLCCVFPLPVSSPPLVSSTRGVQISLLYDMRLRGKLPKLGALQRWVRWVDAAGAHVSNARE